MTAIFTSVLFWQFVILNFINVLINTARSLCTVKGGKWIASLMNALCYGYYTIIIVITATYETPLVLKCVAVAIVNFIGVFTIKFCEEKMTKDRKWVFLATAKIANNAIVAVGEKLKALNIKLLYTEVIPNELYSLQIFSNDKKESDMIIAILNNYGIKYSAIEDKIH